MVRHITERKRAEEALRDSERRFRDVLDTSRDLLYKRSLETDTFDYVSPAAFQLTGFTPQQLAAMRVAETDERIHPDDRRAFKAHSDALLSGSSAADPSQEIEYRWKCKDGHHRWLSNHRALTRDQDGRPVAIVGSIHDITERKRTEQALQKASEELEASVRALREGLLD